jgi:hypothetical protein
MIKSIKAKMLLVILLCMGLGAGGLAWYLQRTFEANAARLTRASVAGATASFAGLARSSTELMAAAAGALALNPDLRAALAARDPDRLLAFSEPLYREYRTRFGITHWNYWEPESAGDMAPKGLRNVLRVGTPTMHGDFVERATLAQVARERRPVTGLDLGYTGMVLRVLVPVDEGGRIIGYLELGREIGGFLREIKKATGDDCGLLLAKARLDAKKWASQRATAGVRDNWGDMPGLVLAENTAPDVDILRFDGELTELADEGRGLELVARGERQLARGVFPIRDVTGNKVGAVFVLHDVSGDYSEMRGALRTGLLAVAGVSILLAAVLIGVFQLLVERRLERMIGVATRVVGGEFDLAIVPSADDEIGAFETLFEQFRLLFVELIGQAQRAASAARDGRGGR